LGSFYLSPRERFFDKIKYMYYRGSINDPKFKKTRGYLCGSFENAPIFSERIEVAHMDYDELKKHINKRHHHDLMDEFVIVIKGYMEQKVDNDLLKLKEGDFLFVKAKSITDIKRVDNNTNIIVIKSPSLPKDKIRD